MSSLGTMTSSASKKTANQIRSEFLNYFQTQGHAVVESSALVPQNDPTLLFTNAGMVQFKDVFLGTDPRPYKRAATSQKCVRAGGKHNDLENVGFTARHHTFFEMLGNFSFGDYFKKDAIHFAWEFVNKKLAIDKSRLYVTVYNDDDEAADIWHKQESIARERIFRFGEKDNFWSMGDTGPCGPCSEIFVDRGEQFGCKKPGCNVGCSCDRFMEIWNLVFMQFERSADGKLTKLPKPSIDTGMGLERVASVVQNVATNYDTDLFQELIQYTAGLAQTKYRQNDAADVSLRVIADHCRASNFLIADGVLPSNEGRGYVLRRIMRRAIRHGRNLGFREPFFYLLTKQLISLMGHQYPELNDKKDFLESTIKLEEERFLVTLENGLHHLAEAMEQSQQTKQTKIIEGNVAFKLYDTFGFPFDLTQIIATEKGFSVDEKGFTEAMNQQKSRSRENWKGSGEEAIAEVYKQVQQKKIKTAFRGYETTSSTGKVLAIIENGVLVNRNSTNKFELVFDQTPFYAESGGQAADVGIVRNTNGFSAQVYDVQKPVGDFVVLYCDNAQGAVEINSIAEQRTDRYQRMLTAKNHTATHLLHHALRKYLGPHVKQAGSLVTAKLLRFDFNHPKPLTNDELEKVENFINQSIAESSMVAAEEMNKEQALARGAIAFFGDKYGASVRVISVGDYSVELCGGTHVSNTSDIQMFKILNENGIAAGVRRITAITGPAVLEAMRSQEKIIENMMAIVKVSAPAELPQKIEKLLQSEKELKKSLDAQTRKSMSSLLDEWINQATAVGSIKLIRAEVALPESENAVKFLRDTADSIRSKTQQSVIVLASNDQTKGQVAVLIAVTKDLIAKAKANEMIKAVAPIIEGSGGGKPELAQAGGKTANFKAVFELVHDYLQKL